MRIFHRLERVRIDRQTCTHIGESGVGIIKIILRQREPRQFDPRQMFEAPRCQVFDIQSRRSGLRAAEIARCDKGLQAANAGTVALQCRRGIPANVETSLKETLGVAWPADFKFEPSGLEERQREIDTVVACFTDGAQQREGRLARIAAPGMNQRKRAQDLRST